MPGDYVELRARSAFSFGDGAISPEALARAAAGMGYTAMALCDDAELGGLIRFALEAEPHGLRTIAGADLKVDGRPVALLARDERGFRNLSALVTQARLQGKRGHPNLSEAELMARGEGLHLLTGPPTGALASLIRQKRLLEARNLLARWRDRFPGRVAVEVQRHHVSGEEAALTAALIELAERMEVPWVVTNEPRYLDAGGRRIHDFLTANRAGVEYAAAQRDGLLLPNGEWRLKSPREMERLWKGQERGLEESRRIADECGFSFRWLRPPLPRYPVPDGHDDDSYLRELVLEGGRRRWGAVGEAERRQIEHELAVIGQLGFAGFFLIMWDAVRFARDRGILCQGRGSAANSVVAYLLEITSVDPVRHGLLFERFLSPARSDGMTEAPDIDVDFEMHRREEVLNYMYERYSRGHAAITAVTQLYHAPSALQDGMRALGYPPELAFTLSRRMRHRPPSEGARMLADGLGAAHGLDVEDARGKALLAFMRGLDDVPRMRSTHPGGFVLSREPLGEYLAIEGTTRGRTILQFDKDDLDAAGVPKFDFLGLGGLTATRIAFDAIEKRTGHRLEMYDLPEEDAATYEMISRGDTVGVFQIESRAQIQSIVQTRPERLYDLVVQVALIRPGPIQAEFVHPYTRRRRGLEKVIYLHPDLEPILGRTQGIPIFQEQAMAIAMTLGGFTATEADELRRSMGHQRKVTRLHAALERLRDRMVGRGIERAVADEIVTDFRTFANYGFPESHAWSFAMITFVTCYLKAHYPAEFLLGLLNAWPMGFYPPSTLVHDAMRHGVEVRPPCMKRGAWESTLEDAADPGRPAVRVGWSHIRGLGARTREALQRASGEAPFASVEDVVRRACLERAEAMHIARAGAFDAFEPGRRRAAWEALRAAGDSLPLAPAHRLPFDPEELEGRERIFLDYLATGISTDGHPMQHLRARLAKAGVASSHDLDEWDDESAVVVAGLVTARQHPSTSKGTVFLLLEDEFGFVNVIVPPRLYLKHREVVNHSPFLLVEGRFERLGPVRNVVGFRFREVRVDSLAHQSRDFR